MKVKIVANNAYLSTVHTQLQDSARREVRTPETVNWGPALWSHAAAAEEPQSKSKSAESQAKPKPKHS